MQKKILIVDYTTHHPEVVGALLTLFRTHRVQLAVTESFQKKYLAPGGDGAFDAVVDPLVRGAVEVDQAWLARLAEVIRDQDIVIFSTPVKGPLLARTLDLTTSARRVLFLHNVNYFLDLEPIGLATFASLRAPRRPRFTHWPAYLVEGLKQRRKAARLCREQATFAQLDRKVDFYCFGSDSVARYFEACSDRTDTVLLPTNAGVARAPEQPEYRGRLHVAIVGSVSQVRKDYRSVLKTLIEADLRRPLTLSLLGSCTDPAYGRELDALVKSNANPQLEIRFDPARPYIPADVLRELLRDVHLLLSPIQLETEYRLHREVYGLSKVSGSEGDCLALGRPLLLPRSYACARYVESLVVHYGDMPDLVAVLDRLNDAAALQAAFERLHEVLASDVHASLATAFLEAVSPSGKKS
jgi:hypothetical protein